LEGWWVEARGSDTCTRVRVCFPVSVCVCVHACACVFVVRACVRVACTCAARVHSRVHACLTCRSDVGDPPVLAPMLARPTLLLPIPLEGAAGGSLPPPAEGVDATNASAVAAPNADACMRARTRVRVVDCTVCRTPSMARNIPRGRQLSTSRPLALPSAIICTCTRTQHPRAHLLRRTAKRHQRRSCGGLPAGPRKRRRRGGHLLGGHLRVCVRACVRKSACGQGVDAHTVD
jgi:hypothetical protein